MHDGEDPVLAQRRAQGRDIGDVADHQLAVLDGAAMPGGQIIVDDDAIAGALKNLGGVAADVAGAAGHEDSLQASAQWRNR